jgi:hypothetical protein
MTASKGLALLQKWLADDRFWSEQVALMEATKGSQREFRRVYVIAQKGFVVWTGDERSDCGNNAASPYNAEHYRNDDTGYTLGWFKNALM